MQRGRVFYSLLSIFTNSQQEKRLKTKTKKFEKKWKSRKKAIYKISLQTKPGITSGVYLTLWISLTCCLLTIFFNVICYISALNNERNIFQTFWKIRSCPDFLSFELETYNFGYFFLLQKLCKVWTWLDKLDIEHFIRVPHLNFSWIQKAKKIKGGVETLIRCWIISGLSNQVQTLHSSAKWKISK